VMSATDDASNEPGGPRRVQIIPILPNGAVQGGPPPQQAARMVPSNIQVPGMSVEFGNTPNRLPPQMAAPPSGPSPVVQTLPNQQQLAAASSGVPQGPARVAVAQVPPSARPPVVVQAPVQASVQAPVQAQPAGVADASASNPVKKVTVAKATVAKSSDAFSPSGAPAGVGAASVAASPASSGANGFVAVVASGGTPKEAMTAYADLKQKYPEVLGDKPADIREAVVNGKTWHRAVIGPPGSRSSVDNLCTQLKASGFLGCWASAY
jgi:hypothetical protein